MKASLLTGFRALAFALSAFALLALGGIKVQSSRDVFFFVISLAVFWAIIERVFLNIAQKRGKPGAPPRAP